MAEQNEKQEKRTTINISITNEDKKTLRIYAAENEKTVAGVIHEFAEKIRAERDGKK